MRITRCVAAAAIALTLALNGCSLFTVDVEREEHKETKVDDDDPPHNH